MAKKIIIANWKMHAPDLKRWRSLYAPKGVKVVICPSFVQIADARKIFKDVSFGAQDVFWENPSGPYTGEISAAMLKNFGAQYVIIGHSERRRFFGETDDMINKKVKASLASKLKVILCVGEPKEIRKKGIKAAEQYVARQLFYDLKGIRSGVTIAYEPVWAIGDGKKGHQADTPEDAMRMAQFIRKTVSLRLSMQNIRILYGGSVTSGNVHDFVQYKNIDGALVGGASLDPEEFKKILTNIL